jgi:hypothetical protein
MTFKQSDELAIILVGITLAFGFVGGSLMLRDITAASWILLGAAVVFGGASAIGAYLLMKETRPH